jgi:N4-(beta-N-acetylglucosaminyl)-L-asparaginase
VGDSPIIGAGLYTDNEVGSAGATGRGEAVIQICGARTIVMRMSMGDHPTDACLYAAKMIADKTKVKRLLDAKGRPNFDVRLYALRKDGAFGSASLWSGADFAVSEGGRHRLEPAAFLFERA